MKKLLFLIFILLQYIGHAQNEDRDSLNARADSLFLQKDYFPAALLYEETFAADRHKNADFLFSAARCWNLSGEREKAIEELTQAISNGYSDAEELQQNEDLENLHTEPGWRIISSMLETQNVQTKDYFFWGMYFGILAILFFYNIFLWFSIRESSFLFYSLMLLTDIFFESIRLGDYGGYIYKALHVETLTSWIKEPFDFFVCLIIVLYLLFLRSFLQSKKRIPKADKWTKGIIIFFAIICTYLALFNFEMHKMLHMISFFAYIFAFAFGVISWKRGYQPARYFVIGSFILTTSVFLLLLDYSGLHSLYFKWGVFRPEHLGLLFFMAFLSFALGDKINFLKRETLEAQEKALVVLEEKVVERTAEIVLQKEIIEEKNKDITDSIRYAEKIQRALLPNERIIDRDIDQLKSGNTE